MFLDCWCIQKNKKSKTENFNSKFFLCEVSLFCVCFFFVQSFGRSVATEINQNEFLGISFFAIIYRPFRVCCNVISRNLPMRLSRAEISFTLLCATKSKNIFSFWPYFISILPLVGRSFVRCRQSSSREFYSRILSQQQWLIYVFDFDAFSIFVCSNSRSFAWGPFATHSMTLIHKNVGSPFGVFPFDNGIFDTTATAVAAPFRLVSRSFSTLLSLDKWHICFSIKKTLKPNKFRRDSIICLGLFSEKFIDLLLPLSFLYQETIIFVARKMEL